MAKKKTAPARLFVPEEEQPYQIPENWCYFYFTSLIDIEGGTQPPKSQFVDTCQDGYIRLVQIRDFATDKYAVYVPDAPKMRHFVENDIMIARYGASLGRICTGLKGVYNVALAKTVFSEDVLYRRYVYWLLQSESFQAPLMQISRTAQAGFNKDDLSTFAMPLPPLPEQQRIVTRIESLFAKLDEAEEKAQAVVDGFELRKSAILRKAFTGELTRKWRKEHGVGIESWRNRCLKDICQYMKAGGDKPADFTDVKDSKHCIPVVANGIAKDGIIGYTSETKYQAGTVTVSGRGTIGYSIYRDYPIYPVVRLVVLCPTSDVLPEFLKYIFDAFPEEGTGSSIPQLTVPSIKGKNVPTPLCEEQIEIVRILKSFFDKEQQAKTAAEAVLVQIDTMKKSILARAFRGELGTNDPAEEWAGEMVKTAL